MPPLCENFIQHSTLHESLFHTLDDYDFFEENADNLQWSILSTRDDLDVDFVSNFLQYIDWQLYRGLFDESFYCNSATYLPLGFLNKYKNELDWTLITREYCYQFDNIEIMLLYREELDWKYICQYYRFDLVTLEQLTLNLSNYLDFQLISRYQFLQPCYIIDHHDKLDFVLVALCQMNYDYVPERFVPSYARKIRRFYSLHHDDDEELVESAITLYLDFGYEEMYEFLVYVTRQVKSIE